MIAVCSCLNNNLKFRPPPSFHEKNCVFNSTSLSCAAHLSSAYLILELLCNGSMIYDLEKKVFLAPKTNLRLNDALKSE